MFFCRHQLLRAPAQRHFSALYTTRHVPRSATAHAPSLHHRYARLSSTLSAPDAEADQSALIPPEPITRTTAEERLFTVEPPEPTTDQVDITAVETLEFSERVTPDQLTGKNEEELMKMFEVKPTSKYLALRDEAPHVVYDFPPKLLKYITLDAARMGRREARLALVEDAVAMCGLRSQRHRYHAIFLLKLLGTRRILPKPQLLALLHALRDGDHLRYCDYHTRYKISMAILAYEPNHEVDGELYDILNAWLGEKVPPDELDGPDKVWPYKFWESTLTKKVPLILWPLFRITLNYARRGEQAKASELITKMARGKRLEPSAIKDTDIRERDYVYVVLSVLVRSCLKFGWFARATQLLVSTVSAREQISQPVAALIEDWLASALTNPREEDLTEAGGMLVLLFKRTENYVVPANMLKRFYDEAAQNSRGELMQAVYRHSREVESHSYDPPSGVALTWLVRYLRLERRDVHLSRVLTQQITDENIAVLPSSRAAIIYNAAHMGFTTEARILWERWTTDPESPYVAGMCAMMLRVVSAFLSAEASAKRLAMQRPPTPQTAAPRINIPDESAERPDDQEEDVQTSVLDSSDEDDHPASDAPQSPSSPPPHADERTDAVLPPSRSGDDGSAPRAPADDRDSSSGAFSREERSKYDMTREELLERAGDIRRFAERVFDACYEAKQPLDNADRFTLNALSRGAFMLGRDAVAFDMFALMKKRGMRLDLHDLNVVLSVVARADPAGGLARIQKMIDSGIQPDAVTYGTVIHWAIYHGDAPLVSQVIQMARSHGLENFTFKTLAALLHATVSPDFEGEGTYNTQLDNVEDIVGTMLDMGLIPTPNVGRDCVTAALNAEDPVTAFRFWKELLKDKVEWGDPGQTKTRLRIAEQIREHQQLGWLDAERALAMLSELGISSFGLHLRRLEQAQRIDG